MPFSGGTSGAHDDAMHQGSAKRDVAEGLAGLDASGFVLAKGAGIAFPRSGSDDVHIYERTSGEEAYAFHRVGADDYTFFIKESNVWKRFQTESMKDVVNGIAALDAGGHVLAPGYRFTAARGAAEQITIRERTSDERVFRWIRNGADDYEARVNVGGVEKVVQHAGLKGAANGIAGLDASGELVESLYAGIGQKYEISDNLLHPHDAVMDTDLAAYTKVKTITINTLSPTPSTLRIKFDLRVSVDSDIAYGRIYKNGGAVGTERSNATSSFVTFSQDLSFANGDTLELWGHIGTPGMLEVRNFRVYGDDHDITLAEAIVASEVGVADCFVGTNS